jgi:hypothetical protein
MFQDSTVTQIINLWIARIGDPYVSSWINTVFYGCSFVAAIHKWKNLRHNQASYREQYLWLFLIFILFVLGANKVLNLQRLLIEVGRHIAEYKGWFEKRLFVQAWFSYVLSGIILFSALCILVLNRKLWRNNALSLLGFSILCVYAVIRTTSINHVGFIPDSSSRGEFRFTDMIEFFGILGIFINAVTHYKKSSSTFVWNSL